MKPATPAATPPIGLMHVRRLHHASDRSGLLAFAGTMLLLSALANALWGIVALVYDIYSAAAAGSPAAWAWVWIGLACVEVVAAVGIFYRSPFAILSGVVIATGNAIAHLFGHYPPWAVIVILVDASVVWALLSYWYHPSKAR